MPSVAARRLYIPPGSVRRLPRWLGPLVTLGALVALGFVFGGTYWETYQLRREAAHLARERNELRRQNAQLREEIRLLKTPEYVERVAREQLGLVKPGEVAVILVPPTAAPVAPSRSEPPGLAGAEKDDPEKPAGGQMQESWWARLLQWLH